MVDLRRTYDKVMKQIYKYLLTLPIIIFLAFPTHSQEQNVVDQGLYWLNYSIGTKINNKWDAKVTIADRRYFVNNRNHMFLIFGDATYKLNKNWSVAGGFMYFNLYRPSDPHSEVSVTQPEFRPYQRLTYKLKTGKKTTFTNRFTLEERIRMDIVDDKQTNDYRAYLRFRNRVGFSYQISGIESQHPLSIYVDDEYMIHVGNTVRGSLFDQNRLGAGLSWKAAKNLTLSSGYIYWYQRIPNSTTEFRRNIINFAVSQRI